MWNTVKELYAITNSNERIGQIQKTNRMITNGRKEVADEFVNFLLNVGKMLAKKIKKPTKYNEKFIEW